MKTILYSGLTANGNYGDSANGQMPKEEELNDIFAYMQQAGNIVMGRRTYEIHVANDPEAYSGIEVVVVSKSSEIAGVKTVASLQEMRSYLSDKGYEQALVIGGVSLANALLTENLIDEMVINIEPYMAMGLHLQPTDGKYRELELLEHKHIGAGIVQIRHKVKN